jgi:hypothetical protein
LAGIFRGIPLNILPTGPIAVITAGGSSIEDPIGTRASSNILDEA